MDPSTPFEINDFTSASDWERASFAFEEALRKWMLESSSSTSSAPQTANAPPTVAAAGAASSVHIVGATGVLAEQTAMLQEATATISLNGVDYVASIWSTRPGAARPPVIDKGLRVLLPPSSHAPSTHSSVPASPMSLSTSVPFGDASGAVHPAALVDESLSPAALDLLDQCDFVPGSHPLQRWYGVKQFVVCEPRDDKRRPTLDDATALLGAMCVAASNIGCSLPMFAQMHDRSLRLWLGRSNNARCDMVFESTSLRSPPPRTLSHLSGMLDLFRSRMGTPVDCYTANDATEDVGASEAARVAVAARFTFQLASWLDTDWRDDDVGASQQSPLRQALDAPIGPRKDPVEALHLATTWPNFPEDAVLDNAVYSELDPSLAPVWTLRAIFTPPMAVHSRLTVSLQRFAQLCTCADSMRRLMETATTTVATEGATAAGGTGAGTAAAVSGGGTTASSTSLLSSGARSEDASEALARLTHGSGGSGLFPHYFDRSVQRVRHLVTAGMDRVVSIVDESLPSLEYVDSLVGDIFEYGREGAQVVSAVAVPRVKGAPLGSTTYALGAALLMVNHRRGGVRAVALVWTAYVRALRRCWESLVRVPGSASVVNMDHSIVQQKLEMLNACIDSQGAREKLKRQQRESARRQQEDDDDDYDDDDDDDDDEEEFFDAEEDPNTVESEPTVAAAGGGMVPEGVVHNHASLCLLAGDQTTPLRVPRVQEAPPLTEDQMEAQLAAYAAMGTTGEAAALRSRLQAASLLSDMEAFKAANPLGVFADFVRWHSPRDWLVDQGQVSERMRSADGLWQDVWARAHAVPVHRQRPLFDATREAEKALHYLETIEPAELVRQLLPSVGVYALQRLGATDAAAQTRCAAQSVQTLADALDGLGYATGMGQEMGPASLVVVEPFERRTLPALAHAEYAVHLVRSLRHKLVDAESLVEALPCGDEVAVLSEHDRTTITEMFRAGEPLKEGRRSRLHEPDAREYLLRAVVSRPSSRSRPCPQRMYVHIGDEEFRVASAHSRDPIVK